MPRNITRITAPSTHPGRRTDIAAAIAGAVAAAPSVPAAPASLTATTGSGRITLGWPAVTGAISYDVETSASSSGTFASLSSSGVTGFTDLMASTAAATFYRVRARNTAGPGPYSPVASATATVVVVSNTGATTAVAVATNLRRLPIWIPSEGRGTFLFSWDGVPGATAYNIYCSDYLLGTVTGSPPATTFQAPSATVPGGLPCYVTAVIGGRESIASGITIGGQVFAPGTLPYNGADTSAPGIVKNLLVTPQWNNGSPRLLVQWGGDSSGNPPYNVYRDGILVCAGLSLSYYIDDAVVAGQPHTYTVVARNENVNPVTEGVISNPVTGTALSTAPSLSATPLAIAGTVPRDDAMYVLFDQIAGAADYILYKYVSGVAPEVLMKSGKAAGEYRRSPYNGNVPALAPTRLAIQINDIDPINPVMLQVAALDKLARYQKQDGMMAMGGAMIPGGPAMPNMANDQMATVNGPIPVDGFVKNGQGDPSSVPNIVALSAPFSVQCVPFNLTGTDGHGGLAFLDRFRDGVNEPIVQVPMAADIVARIAAGNTLLSDNPYIRKLQTTNWGLTFYVCDNGTSKVFFMPHFMSTLADGGGPGMPYSQGVPTAGNLGLHQANSSMVMQPRAADGSEWFADISSGRVLHMTMEVDAHVNSRRFAIMSVKGRGQSLYQAAPTKMHDDILTTDNRSTADANFISLVVDSGQFSLIYFRANGSTTGRPYDRVTLAGSDPDYNDNLAVTRAALYGLEPRANGTAQNLDKMHRFHLYLSNTRFRFVEETPEGTFSVAYERPFPAGVTLPASWLTSGVNPLFIQEIYHTGIDSFVGEMSLAQSFPGGPENNHWINNRPYTDERHWDNMGAEVIAAFPTEPLDLQISQSSVPANVATTVSVTFLPGSLTTSNTRVNLNAPTGTTIGTVTIVDDTHMTVTINAGAAGPMTLRLLNNSFFRSVLLPVV